MNQLTGFRDKLEENLAFLNQAGAAVSVVKDDEVIFAGGFGMKDRELEKKPDEHTLFPIGSASKAFAATTVMLAADQGLVDLDGPLRDYIPELVFQDPVANASVTARDLLCHRTGLPRHDMTWIMRPNITRREIVEITRLLQPAHPFRAKWHYSNLMYTAAGYLVERVTGKSWEACCREGIFEPLAMNRANFNTEVSVIDGNFAQPYALNRKTGALDPVTFSREAAVGPSGSINASAMDMANWVRFNLGQGTFGGKEVLSKKSFAQLVKPNIPYALYPWNEPEIRIMGYGLGWFVDCFRGKTLIHHGGNVNGCSTVVAFMPEINTGITVLVNTGGSTLTTATMYDVFDRLLGFADQKDWAKVLSATMTQMREAGEKAEEQKKAARKPQRTSRPMGDFAGTYVNPAYGTVRVMEEEDRLYIHIAERRGTLENWHFDQFVAELPWDYGQMKLDCAFLGGVGGEIEAMEIPLESAPGISPIRFKKK